MTALSWGPLSTVKADQADSLMIAADSEVFIGKLHLQPKKKQAASEANLKVKLKPVIKIDKVLQLSEREKVFNIEVLFCQKLSFH